MLFVACLSSPLKQNTTLDLAGLHFLTSLIKQISRVGKMLLEVSQTFTFPLVITLSVYSSRRELAENHRRPESYQDRNLMQGMWKSPRPRLWGRSEAHRTEILRQLRLAGLHCRPRARWSWRGRGGPARPLLPRSPGRLWRSGRRLSEAGQDVASHGGEEAVRGGMFCDLCWTCLCRRKNFEWNKNGIMDYKSELWN